MLYFAVIEPRPDPYPEPPSRLQGISAPGPMPRPRILMLQELNEDRGCLAIGYSADGYFCGDTWYPTLREAQDAEKDDRGDALKEWRLSESDDLLSAAITALRYAKDFGA